MEPTTEVSLTQDDIRLLINTIWSVDWPKGERERFQELVVTLETASSKLKRETGQ